jgi:hypothetical protein
MIHPDFRPASLRRQQFERRMDRYPYETRRAGLLPIIGYAIMSWAGVWGAMYIAGWLS